MSIVAEIKWPSENSAQRGNFKGTIYVIQKREDDYARYIVMLEGLPPNQLFGFHIHNSPITNWKDLDKSCKSCGGHFNPTNTKHGSVLNKNPLDRHVGDLINNLKSDEFGNVFVSFTDTLATLIPSNTKDYSVLGKSIVVHAKTDDLGREGTTKNMPYIDGNNIAYTHKNSDVVSKYKDMDKRNESKKTGNAGARIACGNIVEI